MIENIDNYLKKNKKQFFAMMNSHWGKNDDDTKKLKFLWNKALEANGVNNKIEAFENLKKAMTPFIHNDRLAENEKILEDNNIDKFAYPEDQMTLEMDRMFSSLSNFPETDKLQDLNIDDVWSQHYDYDQMKKLASDYGYDYRNKEDRIEFLNKLEEYHKAKNVEDAFRANDIRGVVTDFTLPISKEYAKQNYENINDATDIAGPLVADAAVNLAMMGTPGKFVSNPTAKMVADNITAPIIREAAQMGINDKPLQDAVVDAGGAIATNYATPYALRIPMRWAGRVTQGEVKQGAQDMINTAANKAREIKNKFTSGTPIVKVVENEDGTKTIKYFMYDKKKFIKEVPDHVARKAKNGQMISWKDFDEWQNTAYTNRNVPVSSIPQSVREREEQHIINQMVEGTKKATQNEIEGKPWNSNLNAVEAAGAAGIDPIETRWNWAKSSPVVNDIQSYITNFQGQSRYATPMLNAGTQVLGPAGEYVKIEKKKTLSDSDKKELGMLERLRDLHMKNPKLFGMPKLPDKFKDYVNPEDWNDEQLTIKGIFGGN
jgi:hypothetical protein